MWRSNPNLVVSLFSFDIFRAFDQVFYKKMIYNMKAQAMPHWIIQFIKFFFEDWTTKLLIGGYMAQTMQINICIPQSSILSLILFLFFICTLLPELQRGTILAFGFVNNSNILTYNKTIEENCKALKKAHEVYIV